MERLHRIQTTHSLQYLAKIPTLEDFMTRIHKISKNFIYWTSTTYNSANSWVFNPSTSYTQAGYIWVSQDASQNACCVFLPIKR